MLLDYANGHFNIGSEKLGIANPGIDNENEGRANARLIPGGKAGNAGNAKLGNAKPGRVKEKLGSERLIAIPGGNAGSAGRAKEGKESPGSERLKFGIEREKEKAHFIMKCDGIYGTIIGIPATTGGVKHSNGPTQLTFP